MYCLIVVCMFQILWLKQYVSFLNVEINELFPANLLIIIEFRIRLIVWFVKV